MGYAAATSVSQFWWAVTLPVTDYDRCRSFRDGSAGIDVVVMCAMMVRQRENRVAWTGW